MKNPYFTHSLRFILLAAFLSGWFSVNGQEVPNHTEKIHAAGTYTLVPLYMLVNGLRIDFDRAITPNHWIQAGPVVFLQEDSDNAFYSEDFNSQKGFGLHLYHRYYPSQGFGKTPYYISYGAMWHYNEISYTQWQTMRSDVSKFHKRGFDILLGKYYLISDVVVIDFYAGMGIRFSSAAAQISNPEKFNDTYLSPGYSGTVFLSGIRIGFAR
jgi:hypothetical protein